MACLQFGTLLALTFVAMEGAAAFMHRFVMHGPLWVWHEDHHNQRGTAFQKNDLFALVFAVPSWLLIMFGMMAGQQDARTPIGFGILAYGIVYTLVHETLIHRRFPWSLRLNHWYFQALREAHAVHHRRVSRQGCENFGMLLVPLHFYRRRRGAASSHLTSRGRA